MSADNYKILRALNTKGTVHLAADKDGRKVVLKTLDDDSVSMYRRIAELPPHSYSQRVFECFEQEGKTVAVCEYIEGKTLHELLESGRTFPLKAIKKLICALCEAVEYLHKNSIIHRDINPNNIMLDDKLNLKLIDYSIARLYSGKKDNDTTVLGTEGYSAPEQYGFKETRFTADVYSIGMVLKMLLNSCADGSAAEEVYLRKIAARCTAFDPDSRYKNAGAVRSAVKRSGYVLPVVMGCAVLAFSAVFTMGVLMLVRDTDSGNNSSSIQTATTVATTTTTAATVSTTTSAAVTSPVTTATTTNTTTTTVPVSTTTAATATVTTSTTAVATTTAPVTAAMPISTAAATSTAPVTSTAATTLVTTTTTSATTTKAATTAAAATTSSTPAFQPPEYLELFTLKGSDLDNPNRIEVTTVQDENGNFADSFEYEFFDDPAVHGEWVYCNTWSLTGAKTPATAEGILNHEFRGEPITNALRIHDDGNAEIYYCDGGGQPTPLQWTNGYIIDENGYGTFAQRLFVSVIDDVEFLFMEFKSGDYVFRGEINCYYIFVRSESEAAG